MTIPIRDLFDLDGEAFVLQAFRRILSREPDAAGSAHYKRLFDLGVSKVQILSDLATSKEAREKNIRIPELARLETMRRRAGWPVIGRLFSRGIPYHDLETAEARHRARLLALLERATDALDGRATVPVMPLHGDESRLATNRTPAVAGLAAAPALLFTQPVEPATYLALADRPDPISHRYLQGLRDANHRMQWPVARQVAQEPILISILMPVYKVPLVYLDQAIASVRRQTYSRWELCIVDDGSQDAALAAYLEAARKSDPRIKLQTLEQNAGISTATNAAFDMSSGSFVGLLDNDDVLTLDALDCVAAALVDDPSTDYLYSDEFKIDDRGFATDLFPKPDWSPSALLNCMYTGHFSVYRRSTIIEAGRFRPAFDFSQDYDLVLRVTELTTRIRHLPRGLYGWRMIPGSSAQGDKPAARQSNLAALSSALTRRGVDAEVLPLPAANYPRVRSGAPAWKASIVIPSDNAANISATIESIRSASSYPDLEILVVTNSGIIREFRASKKHDAVRFVAYDKPFNFSDKCNVGAEHATGKLLIFFNDDVRVVSTDWIERLLEAFVFQNVGIVGPKLLYENYTIQHAGMVSGCRGLVGTAFHCRPHETLEHFGAALWLREVSLICGALLAIPAHLFRSVGGFDAVNTPISHSDVDLCFRIREAGYQCLYTPYATLIHIGHLSLAGEDAKAKAAKKPVKDKSDIFLLRRWGNEVGYDPFYPPAMRDILYHDSPERYALHPGARRVRATGGADVLLVSHDLSSSGAPRVVFEIASALRSMGHFVTVITPEDGPFRARLTDIDVPVIVDELALRRHDSLLRLARNFDLVVCNTVVTWPAVLQLSSALPVYWYIHEMSLLTHLLGTEPLLASAFGACSGGVWAGSEHAAALIRPYRADVAVLEYGVSELKVTPKPHRSSEPIQIGIFGSFEPRKGQDLAVAAIAALPPEYRRRIRLNLFGRVLDTGFFDSIRQAAALMPEIRIHPELTHDEYVSRMGEMDLVLLSSRDDTLPLVSIDALSAGKVLVVTRTTGTSAYLTHGQSGYVAPAADPTQIATTLREAIDDFGHRRRTGRNAQRAFEQHFSLAAFKRKLSLACDLAAFSAH